MFKIKLRMRRPFEWGNPDFVTVLASPSCYVEKLNLLPSIIY
jgi:hypothetical protein